MISNVNHILPLAKIRRRRFLPIEGTVLVRAGQTVSATDVIAQADLNAKHIMLDVARGLGVSLGKAGQYIKRQLGDEVPADSIIAERGGFGRVVRSPAAGKIVAISGGQVLLEIKNEPYSLLAGLSGTITEIEAGYGAYIEATGAWIQGVWGNNKIAIGGLTVLAEEPDHQLTANDPDPSQRGSIVLAGHCSDRRALDATAKSKWKGLILASMSTQLVPLASRMPFPVMVLEGFGEFAMNAVAHRLLASSHQREVVINTMPFNHMTGERPEVVIPLESSSVPPVPPDLQQLETGLRVRMIHSPHMCEAGTITKLLPGYTKFPSGLRATGAEVEMDDGEKVVVPLANIEVLG